MAARGWQKAAKNWEAKMQTSSQAYQDGINAVTESPMEKAAAAVNKYVEGVQRSAANGKYASKLRDVSTQDWKKAATAKASRLADGARAASDKVNKFWQSFGPFQEQVAERVRSMPNNTIQERIQRAVAQMEGTHQYQDRYQGR